MLQSFKNKTIVWLKKNLNEGFETPISLDRRYDVALLLRSTGMCACASFENKFPLEM